MEKKAELVSLSKFLAKDVKHSAIRYLVNQQVPKKCAEVTGMLLKALNRDNVHDQFMRSYAFRGIPSECHGLRGLIWRLLIGYLPNTVSNWSSFLEDRRQAYASLARDYPLPELPRGKERKGKVLTEDQELERQIRVDVKRTKKEVPLFARLASYRLFPETQQLAPIEESKETKELSIQREDDDDEAEFTQNGQETHRQVLVRLLYIYSKTATYIGYVQGMNELMAVLYFCFLKDEMPDMRQYHECDTFFCFNILMSELKDSFLREMDQATSGIHGTLQGIQSRLEILDPEYSQYLRSNKADLQLFALRWLILLFAQDMPFESVIYLWDSLLADRKRFLFLRYVILQIILDTRKEVMGEEFYIFIKKLQDKPHEVALSSLLGRAGALLFKDLGPGYEEYIGEHY